MLGKLAILSLVSFSFLGPSMFADDELPAEVVDRVVRLQELASRVYAVRPYRRKEIAKLGTEFDSTLVELSKIDNDAVKALLANPGERIEARLIAIARDRAKRPEVYAEIERVYLRGVRNPSTIAPSSPPVREEHRTEKYRLVWEYYLLRPPFADASQRSQLRVSQALAALANSDSLVAVVESYRAVVEKTVVDRRSALARQRLLLVILGQFPSEKSVRKMFECQKLHERKKAQFRNWNMSDYLYLLLTDQGNFGLREKWYEALKNMSRDGLNESENELLDKAITYYEKKPSE